MKVTLPDPPFRAWITTGWDVEPVRVVRYVSGGYATDRAETWAKTAYRAEELYPTWTDAWLVLRRQAQEEYRRAAKRFARIDALQPPYEGEEEL